MSVVIRLARRGRKKCPSYRLQVIDSRFAACSGRTLDIVGAYNPLGEKESFQFKPEKLQLWLSRGARPTRRVKDLLKKYSKPSPEPVGK
ncbi:30S ribosomal protein S16 [Bdellovibrionota bacterium]